MIYQVEIRVTGWATKTVQVMAKNWEEASDTGYNIAREIPSDELDWVLDDSPYDIHVQEAQP